MVGASLPGVIVPGRRQVATTARSAVSWLQSVERLSRSVPSELAGARQQVRQLVAAARAVAPTEFFCAPGGSCAHDCPLAQEPDGTALCALAQRLATLDGSGGSPSADASAQRAPADKRGDDDETLLRWRWELAGSLDLVRTCRQTAHPAGTCWLGRPDGSEGCSEVLRVAHREARGRYRNRAPLSSRQAE